MMLVLRRQPRIEHPPEVDVMAMAAAAQHDGLARAQLVLVVDLVTEKEVPRMPPEPFETVTIAGVAVPRLHLGPFELSAALKLKLALLWAASQRSRGHA